MSKKIYVGYLAPETSRGALERLFSRYGAVRSVNLITDRDTGRPRGFGFVEMETDEAAAEALKALSGTKLGGSPLKLSTRPLDR